MSELLLGLGIGIAVMLSVGSIAAIRLRKTFLKMFQRSIAGHKGNELSILSRLDKGLTRAFIEDLTQKDNPIGFALSLLPNSTDYLKQNPTSIIGGVELFKAIMGIPQFLEMVSNGIKTNTKSINKRDSPYEVLGNG